MGLRPASERIAHVVDVRALTEEEVRDLAEAALMALSRDDAEDVAERAGVWLWYVE